MSSIWGTCINHTMCVHHILSKIHCSTDTDCPWPFSLDIPKYRTVTHSLFRECQVMSNWPWWCLVSFPDPFRKNREGVWQHVLHRRVQKEFNQLLNHMLMCTWVVPVIGCVTSQLYAVLVCRPSDHGAMSVLCLACGGEAVARDQRVRVRQKLFP